ncbi:MAG: hypothetical protein AB8G17_16890 [Gammaproteobacteria bacterium]
MIKTLEVLIVASLTASAVFTCAATPAPEPVIVQHVVEAGDTLANLGRRHLGADAPWNINIPLNPQLANPNALTKGQVVNIITGYAFPKPEPEPPIVVEEVKTYQAIVEQVANDVEKNIKQTDWRDASRGDELFPLDAIRTLSNSSALLRFDGTSEVLISAYSQIFLRALESQDSGLNRSEIEIKRGSTDLRLSANGTPEQEIEINVAGTITRPRRARDGTNATRARKVGNDTSQVMVYAGESAVESAGVSVAVEQGMGTVAVAGQAPAKPERLLEAPLIDTIDSKRYPTSRQFSWQAVSGAARYRFELCLDRRCTKPVQVLADIESTAITLDTLPVGDLFWRVTAVSQSGLDGFTSNADQITVVNQPPPEARSPFLVYFGPIMLALIITLTLIASWGKRNVASSDAEA